MSELTTRLQCVAEDDSNNYPVHVKKLCAEAASVLADAKDACCALVAWGDSENAGPDYGTLTRDTHPDGELIWRRWWDDQQRLCARAFDTARTALAKASVCNASEPEYATPLQHPDKDAR